MFGRDTYWPVAAFAGITMSVLWNYATCHCSLHLESRQLNTTTSKIESRMAIGPVGDDSVRIIEVLLAMAVCALLVVIRIYPGYHLT